MFFDVMTIRNRRRINHQEVILIIYLSDPLGEVATFSGTRCACVSSVMRLALLYAFKSPQWFFADDEAAIGDSAAWSVDVQWRGHL